MNGIALLVAVVAGSLAIFEFIEARDVDFQLVVVMLTLLASWLNLSGRLDALSERLDALSERVGVIAADLKAVNRTLERHIRNTMRFYSKTTSLSAVVSDRLDIRDPFHGDNFDSDSPINLSKKGAGIARKLDVSETVAEMLPRLLELVPEGSTVYEVQEITFDYALNDFLSEVDFDLKNKVHTQAFEDKGDLPNVLMIYGILFRNAVMKQRGMKVPPPPKP